MAISTRLIFSQKFIISNTLIFNPISHSTISINKNRSCHQNSRFFNNNQRIRSTSSTKRDVVVHNSVVPGVPPPPNSWQGWILGAVITIILPFFTHRWGPLYKITKQVEAAVETVEHVTEVVESVAEQVEKVADEIGNQLPEGGKLRGALDFVENAAKNTAKVAHIADEVIDKVQEVEEEVDSFMQPVNEQAKGEAEIAKFD